MGALTRTCGVPVPAINAGKSNDPFDGHRAS
jgi:hypothetical protein